MPNAPSDVTDDIFSNKYSRSIVAGELSQKLQRAHTLSNIINTTFSIDEYFSCREKLLNLLHSLIF